MRSVKYVSCGKISEDTKLKVKKAIKDRDKRIMEMKNNFPFKN